MKVVCLWSGGKDSCFACYKAKIAGHEILGLFNFTDAEGNNSLSHGLAAELIVKQAGLIAIPLVQKAMPKETYETAFKSLISDWKKKKGIEGVVFGDIFLKEHKDWIDRVCRELKVKPILPLWDRGTKELILEMLNSGFKSIIVSAKADVLGKDFIGRLIDKELVRELQEREICPCGENGEFHSFVIDGPIFKNRIEILESKPILKEGFWKYWFLDIRKYRVVEKVRTDEGSSGDLSYD